MERVETIAREMWEKAGRADFASQEFQDLLRVLSEHLRHRTHFKCARCGLACPSERAELLNTDTCPTCTAQPRRVKKVKYSSGGGQAREVIEYVVIRDDSKF